MSNFTVKDPPEYNDEMRMLEPTDPAHADVFNALFEQLINNDAFLATLARKTAEVVEEFIISKGMPKGIASLDESGNVPKEQIKLAAEDVGALPLFENRLTLRETGWYRICQPKFGNATSFSIRFIKDHGEGEVLSLNISATEYKIENIGHYNVYISQLLKQGDAILDKIRIVSSDEMNPVYIDIHYTLNEENNFCIQIDSVLSNGDKNFNIELLEKNPQIFETQSIHEWNYTRNGLIADSAIEDGEGNNIAETYFTNTKGDELKKSVSDGKKLVANAITAKGVTTAVDAAFATIATNISQITTGVDTSDANAGVEHILSGKTAYVNGVKITGTMANRESVTSALNAGDSYTIPSGFHNGSGKVTANSLASQTQGTATDSEVLQGKTAWVNGAKVTGSIPKAPTFPNENSGLDLHLYGSTPGGQDHNIFMMIPKGYYNETWVGYKDPNLIPANIKKGVKIGGGLQITGTYEGEQKGGIIEEIIKTYTVTTDNPIVKETYGNIFKNPILKKILNNSANARKRYVISCYSTIFARNGANYAGFDFWYIISTPKGPYIIMSRTKPSNVTTSHPITILANSPGVWRNCITNIDFNSFAGGGIYTNLTSDINLINSTFEVANLNTTSDLSTYGPFLIESTYRIEQNF